MKQKKKQVKKISNRKCIEKESINHKTNENRERGKSGDEELSELFEIAQYFSSKSLNFNWNSCDCDYFEHFQHFCEILQRSITLNYLNFHYNCSSMNVARPPLFNFYYLQCLKWQNWNWFIQKKIEKTPEKRLQNILSI